jgi:hypothetical protein
VLAIPLVLAFGIVEGLWSNRWAFSGETERAAARLKDVPRVVGDWEGQDRELDTREAARAEISGYLMRQYVHRRTGSTVTVLLVCGQPGPVAAHTPDVCYRGGGYRRAGSTTHHVVRTTPSAEFWTARFEKSGSAIPEQLRIFWAWSAGGPWSAPDAPRFAFPGAPALYKLYVIRRLARPDEPLEKDPTAAFLRVFVPEVNRCLFPPT